MVTLERVLRTINLNVQSKKTEIKSSQDLIDEEVEQHLELMENENENSHENAVTFIREKFTPDKLSKFNRSFRRALTVLKNEHDESAVEVALEIFLDNPEMKISTKTFSYLRWFVTSQDYSNRILERLKTEGFTFPYHRAMMFRLAAYCRGESNDLVEAAIEEALNQNIHWFPRMSALFCLSTFKLDPAQLAEIDDLSKRESDCQVLRAAFVVMAQHVGDQLRWVLDQVNLIDAPNQNYLRRYFYRLYNHENLGIPTLREINKATLNWPLFIHHLHKLDLMKANQHADQRELFLDVVSSKIDECAGHDWPRLEDRLQGIHDAFAIGA